MARKPKVIEIPGDNAPVSEAAQVAAKLMAPPEAPTEDCLADGTPILERRCGWILTPYGWSKE